MLERYVCRADGLIQDVMAAGSKLALAQEPVVAVAFSAMLLAFSREKLHQTVLAQKDSMAVLGALLEVLLSLPDGLCYITFDVCGPLSRDSWMATPTSACFNLQDLLQFALLKVSPVNCRPTQMQTSGRARQRMRAVRWRGCSETLL